MKGEEGIDYVERMTHYLHMLIACQGQAHLPEINATLTYISVWRSDCFGTPRSI
jgi:hypothetical protein